MEAFYHLMISIYSALLIHALLTYTEYKYVKYCNTASKSADLYQILATTSSLPDTKPGAPPTSSACDAGEEQSFFFTVPQLRLIYHCA